MKPNITHNIFLKFLFAQQQLRHGTVSTVIYFTLGRSLRGVTNVILGE